ncbi:hypothetical protein H0H87_010440 [Tephrocybe sp. NHM501043]|nr:hypothetical protein H0H87_010440 [Tephrocybe sp. NHM501043]
MVNDPGMYRNLVDSADIYGIDAYPVCKFQGGAYDPWGSQNGYDNCRILTDPNFQRVHNFHLWANGVTAVNFYMFYGGTNWGQIPFSNTYTSYDYGAAIAENRELSAKFNELKLQALFLRTFADIRATVWKGEDNTTFTGVTTTHLQNPETGASFYIVRHTKSSDPASVPLRLTVGFANTIVPQLGGNSTLLGRDSFVVSADLAFGSSKLLYSTAMLLSTIQLDGDDALIVYGNTGLVYEVAIQANEAPAVVTSGATKVTTKYFMLYDLDVMLTVFQADKSIVINFTVASGITTVRLGGHENKDIVLLIADYDTATTLWMPTIAGQGPLAEFIDVEASAPLVVRGAYLVRTATLSHNALALTGDLDVNEESTTLTIYGPSTISSLTWNGKRVNGVNGLKRLAAGTWQAKVYAGSPQVGLPDLAAAEWKYRDSLPEIKDDFAGDASLVPADHTTTTSKFPPYYGGPWILYADDYGFHGGNLLWRGTFQNDASLPAPTAVNISVSGGIHFAASVWLNEHFLGTSDTRLATNNETWPVTQDMLRDGENHVVVLQEYVSFPPSPHNYGILTFVAIWVEILLAKLCAALRAAGRGISSSPGVSRCVPLKEPVGGIAAADRGLQGYYLEGRPAAAQFTKWELAGNFGGEEVPDKTRKILNEGA